MSGAFSAECQIIDTFGRETKWSATFTVVGGERVTVTRATKQAAQEWLASMTRAFLGERVLLDAPDGDGVVVSPHHEDRVVFMAPAVAVRVREASPMFSKPQTAAQVAERIHYATRLLDEAAGLLTDLDFAGDLAPMVWAAKGRLVTLAERSACEVLEQWPPVSDRAGTHAPRHLVAVPHGGVA